MAAETDCHAIPDLHIACDCCRLYLHHPSAVPNPPTPELKLTPPPPARQTAPELIKPGTSPSRPAASSPTKPKPSPRKRGAAVPDDDWWPDGPGTEKLITERGRPRLRISTDHLLFPLTALGVPGEATLFLTNEGEDTLSGNVFGYSQPYLVKVGGGAAHVGEYGGSGEGLQGSECGALRIVIELVNEPEG